MNLSAAELSTLRWKSSADSVAEADALLARLWSSTEQRQQIGASTSSDGSGATPLAVRTGVMNLVVVAPGEERAVGAASSLTSLQRSPSRTLFIVPRDPEGPPTFRARLEVFCAVTPRGDGTSACTELLWIDASGEAGRHLSSMVPQLSLHDLPTLLWWDHTVDPTSRDLKELLRGVDRILVNGAEQRGVGIEVVRDLISLSRASGTAISDFSLIRQARWRDAVASAFDEPEVAPFLRAITKIRATYSAGSNTSAPVNVVKPTYHLAWLTSRLNARVSAPLVNRAGTWNGTIDDEGRSIALALEPVVESGRSGTTLALHITAERRGSVLELNVHADGASTHVRASINGTPVHERTLRAKRATDAELLSHALELGEVDPLSPSILRAFAQLVG
ncbi:MAG: glucose-6-phosphate dehydrogenase assembly protein OpcA [Candidatus Limnocylindrus sp.]|jgi:glucose-6-phosphate dehydrogenase assembly protein OpcA